jgi:hypothetical protein
MADLYSHTDFAMKIFATRFLIFLFVLSKFHCVNALPKARIIFQQRHVLPIPSVFFLILPVLVLIPIVFFSILPLFPAIIVFSKLRLFLHAILIPTYVCALKRLILI